MGMVILILMASVGVSSAMDTMIADITEPVQSPFATYYPIPVSIDPSVEPWEIEPDLSNVENADDFDLTDEEKRLLSENSFVVIPTAGNAEVYDTYNANRDFAIPSYISSDAFLHAYHILFDYILKKAELDHLRAALDSLNSTAANAAEATLAEAVGQEELISARLLLAFHSVSACLLDSTFEPNPEVESLVNQELSLINAASILTNSPIFGYEEDYTQYKIRGNYTTDDALERYFRAMMWYGRMTFVLDFECDIERVREHTRSALFLVRDMARHPACHPLWTHIYWPTVFFVGRADDIVPDAYRILAEEIYGESMEDLSTAEISDPVLLEQFIDEARERFEQPEIGNAGYQGMRFMGQRFIPDSYVFEQVVFPHCQRTMPRGLDIMASLGSDRAMYLLDTVYNEFTDPVYVDQIYAMRTYMESVADSTWAENLFYNWLYSLMPLLFEKDEGWPVFMTNPAWADRELSTSLMSWGELRHDTILYAKQSYTVGIDPGAALLQNYVEPNPYLWARLASLAEYTRTGLSGLGLLEEPEEDRLVMLRDISSSLLDISMNELNETPLSPAQDSLLSAIGLDLQILISVDEPSTRPGVPDWDAEDQTAVIADVHTDLTSGSCLEEGVGYPWELLVGVRRNGTIYLTRGVFIPYYEFTLPMSERMTDDEWREFLTGTTPPSPPVWTTRFYDSTVSLLNPAPAHYLHTTKLVVSFSCTISPAVLDTGMTATVDVYWEPYWYGGVPQPQLLVTDPAGNVHDVFLDLVGEHLYRGAFPTAGWVQGNAYLAFTCVDPDNQILLDWGTTVQVDPAASPPAPLATDLTIHSIRPHPVNDEATIRFSIPETETITLSLWDLAGRERAVLYTGELAAGSHELFCDFSKRDTAIPAGSYMIRISAGAENAGLPVVFTP